MTPARGRRTRRSNASTIGLSVSPTNSAIAASRSTPRVRHTRYSATAQTATMVASRPSTVDTAIELQRIWLGLTRSQVFPASPLTVALGALGVRDHSFPPSGLQRVIERQCDFARLEDAAVPVHVVAADVLTGEE